MIHFLRQNNFILEVLCYVVPAEHQTKEWTLSFDDSPAHYSYVEEG